MGSSREELNVDITWDGVTWDGKPPNTGHYTWSTDSNTEMWFGETNPVEFCDPATTPWQPLYHEEDYQGIADQLKAEEMGLTKLA